MSFTILRADEGYGGRAGLRRRALRGGSGGGDTSSSSKGSVSSSMVS